MEHAALDHLPFFITPPGQTDVLMVAMAIFLLLAVLGVGVLYFTIHALPEHLAHGGNKIQMQIVAVLAILALFTHNHIFWIAGLLLALVQFPDFESPMVSMADSLAKMAGRKPRESTAIEIANQDGVETDAGHSPALIALAPAPAVAGAIKTGDGAAHARQSRKD
jgi:hypothetical protein